MVTIKDISKKCGVSSATVSKVLNGRGDIGEETSKRIKAVAKEMGYFPNSMARTLKTKKSNNLGVLFTDETNSGLTHEYFSAILNSFKNQAEELGYDITFLSQKTGDMKLSYLEHCKYRYFDGIVVANVDFEDSQVLELVQSDMPTVIIDYLFNNKTTILSDNVTSLEALITHVHEKGHSKIAFIHGELTLVTKNRLAGFYKTCQALGIEVNEDYIKQGAYHNPKESGLATRELLKLKDPPTCILYPDDFSYIGGMNEIERQGLSIPADISTVGYDGIYLSQVLRPKLTTWKQDTDILGKEAAIQLIDTINNPKTFIPKQITVPGTLLVGKSVQDIRTLK